MYIKTALNINLSIDEFRHELGRQKKRYLLFNELPADKVYLQFEGKLAGELRVWNACIRTIEEYARVHHVESDPEQFIDIQIKNACYLIEIALNIKQIDRAAVESTIIMIRKYKRLQPGRHHYGVRSKTQ